MLIPCLAAWYISGVIFYGLGLYLIDNELTYGEAFLCLLAGALGPFNIVYLIISATGRGWFNKRLF